jgi:hypothetical protein
MRETSVHFVRNSIEWRKFVAKFLGRLDLEYPKNLCNKNP